MESLSDQRRWQETIDAFNNGEFERLAALLTGTDTSSLRIDQSYLIRAAYQICLACIRSKEDMAWHHKAYQDTAQRAGELQQQLSTILNMISELESSHGTQGGAEIPTIAQSQGPLKDIPKKKKPHGIWRRVRTLLDSLSLPINVENELLSTDIPGILSLKTPSSISEVVETISLPPKDSREVEQDPSSLFVYCLGHFRIFQGEKEINEWHSFKGRDIFKYLLVRRETPVAKDILMEVFWPDTDPQSARRNLHQTIYSLRQTLRGEQPEFHYVWFENDCYFINPQMHIWLDFIEFEKSVQAGQLLEKDGQTEEAIEQYGTAEGLYQGDFLEEDVYEDWPTIQREQLRNLYMSATDRLCALYFQNRQFAAVVPLCQKVLAKDRCYETAHRRLMQCYLAFKQRHLAVRQYQICDRALREELGIPPSGETVELYQYIVSQSDS